jgi:hypothetical protein
LAGLLDKYLLHYDPLWLGAGLRGLANGMHATLGQLFPRCGGGYNLYRGAGGVEAVDFEVPVGAAGRGATEIRNFPERGHDTEVTYWYALRPIGPGGVEQPDVAEWALVGFDAAGALIDPPVRAPWDPRAEPLKEGRFRISWRHYAAADGAGLPQFRVYTDNGSGTIDYGTVVAAVPFRMMRREYAYESGAFGDGTLVRWAVRAVNSNGQEERNTLWVSARASHSAPAANPGVIVE